MREYVKDFAVCVYRTSKEATSIRETMLGGEIYKVNYLQKGRLLSVYEQYSEALITYDAALKKSKLRSQSMSDVINRIKAGSVVLFNESFSSTNKWEGSEIGRQIVDALIEKQIKVVFVTHMFEFANGYYQKA